MEQTGSLAFGLLVQDFNGRFFQPETVMDDVRSVSSLELAKDVTRYHELALTRPLVVLNDKHEPAVMISAEEYRRLRRLDRRVFASGELPDELVSAIERSEVGARHAHLDDLLEDWTP